MLQDWLLNLPVAVMAPIVFGGTYLAVAAIYFAVTRLAVGERARAFKGLSPAMLPPLGIIFGLLVGFTAAQVWTTSRRPKLRLPAKRARFARSCCWHKSFPQSKARNCAVWSTRLSNRRSSKSGRRWRGSALRSDFEWTAFRRKPMRFAASTAGGVTCVRTRA
jgi:hypothetical protein